MGIRKTTIERVLTLSKAGYSCADIAKILGIAESAVRTVIQHHK